MNASSMGRALGLAFRVAMGYLLLLGCWTPEATAATATSTLSGIYVDNGVGQTKCLSRK